jgi:hypothetical protein
MLRNIYLVLISITVFAIIVLINWENGNDNHEKKQVKSKASDSSLKTAESVQSLNEIQNTNFDPEKDVLVFIHVQKSGTSEFGTNLVKYLQVYEPNTNTWRNACNFKTIYSAIALEKAKQNNSTINRVKLPKIPLNAYECLRTNSTKVNWQFSQYIFHSTTCGEHYDLTRAKNCVPSVYKHANVRNYVNIGIFRNPVKRFISEWKHVQRGVVWDGSQNVCNPEGKQISETCFGKNRENLTLNDFLSSCKSHVSKNRYVRWHQYYDEKTPDCSIFDPKQSRILLQKAKENLLKLKYFAILEYQLQSQKLFEATFRNLKFSKDLKQFSTQRAESFLDDLDNSKGVINRVKQANSLDIEFYEYALKLFFERLKYHDI